MSQQYTVNGSSKGVNGYGIPFPENNFTVRLAATTDTTFTVPGGLTSGIAFSGSNKYLLNIKYEDAETVFVALNEAAAAPAGAAFAASTSIINPDGIIVKAADAIHFFAVNADTDVSVSVWPIQE